MFYSPNVKYNRIPKNVDNFSLWNPESWALESGIQLKESGIPLMIGIQVPIHRNPRNLISNNFCFSECFTPPTQSTIRFPKNVDKFSLWNPESWALESGIQLKESGIPLMIGIQNPSSIDKESTAFLPCIILHEASFTSFTSQRNKKQRFK